MKIELNIFTNCTKNAPSTNIIRRTRDSFFKTFGEIPLEVWLDKNPETEKMYDYQKNLTKLFAQKIRVTNSLSEGYIRAIQRSEADFLFMLEHDWIFNNNIKHNLDYITNKMKSFGLYHLRFNKRDNKPVKWDKTLIECGSNAMFFLYCKTPCLSNNPHIIDRKKYLDFIEKGYIKVLPGSKGIEEIISKQKHLNGAIYGPLGYPATVTHIDGRK